VWKDLSGKGKSELQIYNSGSPFERLRMNILGPFLIFSLGDKYLLVSLNSFTKWVKTFPIKNFRTKTIAEIFVNQVISKFGVLLE